MKCMSIKVHLAKSHTYIHGITFIQNLSIESDFLNRSPHDAAAYRARKHFSSSDYLPYVGRVRRVEPLRIGTFVLESHIGLRNDSSKKVPIQRDSSMHKCQS